MESLFYNLADNGEWLFQALWFPILIWTIIGSAAWLVLKSSDQIHPEYQYHSRLALIFSLPAGLILMALIHQISVLTASTDAAAGYHFITLAAPFEITVTPGEESTGLPFISILFALLFLVLISGLMTTLGKFLYQCIQLRQLRNRCSLTDILNVQKLNSVNIGLALASRKPVKVAFLTSDIVPVTFGIRQPVVLLPQTLKDDPRKLNLAVRHELTHIIQNDFFTHLMVIISKALFWFHPLMHRLSRELVEYREMRCDYRVLHEKSVSRKEYAMLLLELIPMPNIDKTLSVNMAQESSNLKKRITMITQQSQKKPIPVKSSLALLGAILISTAIAMACTDMQTQNVFDEEELNLMTDIDYSGERGYHQIIIYLGDEEQAQRHENLISQLNHLKPDYVDKIEVLNKAEATNKYGNRGEYGVIEIQTRRDADAINTTLRTLGMEEIDIENPPPAPSHPDLSDEDFFMVVEQMPELIGGLSSVMQEIKYPEEAREAGMEGRVFVQFIVDENGDVVNPQIIRSAGDPLDEEALRVVEQVKFEPGMQRPVKVQYSLPIFFRLQGSEPTPEQSEYTPDGESTNEMTVTGYDD